MHSRKQLVVVIWSDGTRAGGDESLPGSDILQTSVWDPGGSCSSICSPAQYGPVLAQYPFSGFFFFSTQNEQHHRNHLKKIAETSDISLPEKIFPSCSHESKLSTARERHPFRCARG
jgi:hypothetical protein